MTSYVPGNTAVANYSAGALTNVELRVISTLLQQQSGNMQQDELKQLRNDQAFDMGLTTPVPGN